MSATIVGLADAVVDRLNTVSFSQSFEAVRDLFPITQSEDIDELEVNVVAGPENWAKLDRGANYLVTYDVLVVVDGPVGTAPDIEDYVQLVEEIKADLVTQKAAGLNVVEVVQDAPFNQERLYTENIFFTVITFRFRGFK
jgi:hypothetical protein